jgi:type II secretory pathway component PulF
VKFSYHGFDKSGAKVADVVEAADRAEAIESLRRRGVFASEVVEARGGAAKESKADAGSGKLRLRLAGGQLESVASFTRQLSLLVSTGTPLVEALASLEQQTPEGPFKLVLSDMRGRVEEGQQLSDAMAAHPREFDAVCRSLICAGEQGGKLDVMLQRLSALIRQQVKVRKTVKGAMVYPCLLICVAIVVVCAMLGFVLPRFEGLFKSLDTPLPATTKILMSASEVLRAYWWAFLIGLVGAGVGTKFWLGTAGGRLALDRFLVTAPLGLGKTVRSFATARIARMMGTLLDGKVALLETLGLTRQSMSNSLYISLLKNAEEAVVRGENVSAALAVGAARGVPLIIPSVLDALKSGERNGQMAPVLTSVAVYLDEDNEVLVKTLTGLLEPIILIVLGLVVGMVAISMFLPLFDLTAAAGAPGGGGA